MPCNTIRTTNVVLDTTKLDTDLLTKAIEELGYRVVKVPQGLAINDQRGYLVGSIIESELTLIAVRAGEADETTNAIKRAYSRQVVKKATAKFGWKVAQKDERHFVAVRRGL